MPRSEDSEGLAPSTNGPASGERRLGACGAVAPGVYLVRLHYPGGVQTRRLLYLK